MNNLRQNQYIYAMNRLKSSNNAILAENGRAFKVTPGWNDRGDFERLFRGLETTQELITYHFMINSRQNKYIYAMNTLKSSNNAKHLIYWQKTAKRSKSPRAGVTLNALQIMSHGPAIMVKM